MVAVFCGQLVGTAVGNKVYAVGGWRASGGTSMGFVGVGICVALSRGPWENGWVGWTGGWGRKMKGENVEVGEGGETVVRDEEANGESRTHSVVEGSLEERSSDTVVGGRDVRASRNENEDKREEGG